MGGCKGIIDSLGSMALLRWVPLLLVGVCTANLQHQLFADFEALKQELESSVAVEGKMRAESNLVEADFEAAAASPPRSGRVLAWKTHALQISRRVTGR